MSSSSPRRRRLSVALLGLVALVGTACSDTVPSGTAATVNGETISISLLDRIVDAQVATQTEAQGISADSDEARALAQETARNILSALISFEITEEVAAERGIEASEEEIDDEFDVQIGLAGGEEVLTTQLEDLGLSEEEFKDIIVRNTVLARELQEAVTAEVELSDDDVRAAFEERQAAGQYDVATVSHILIGFGDDVQPGAEPTAEQDAEAETAARDVLDRLADGESFEELAVELSDDPGSGANGGSLGEAPLNRYVPEFAAAAAEAEVGEVVGPVRTQFGYHLIRVDEREDVTFEDVEEQLRTELAGQASGGAFEDELLAALAEAEVVVPERIGVWNPETGAVEDARDPVDDISPAPAGTEEQ